MQITIVFYRKLCVTIITSRAISESSLAELSRLISEFPLLVRETPRIAFKDRKISH